MKSKESLSASSPPVSLAGQPLPVSPVVIDVVSTLSSLFVLLVSILIVLLSLLSGAGPVDVALRGVVSILTLGLLAWFINWLLARNALEAAALELKKRSEMATSQSTVERLA